MTNSAFHRKNRDRIWHPYTRHSAMAAGFPVIARGKGVYLYDKEGRRYLDAVSSWWACNLGHGEPAIVNAICRQARQLQHSILGNLSHAPALALAAELVKLFPDPVRDVGVSHPPRRMATPLTWPVRDSRPARRVFFSSDGSAAVEAALKIAVQYWHNRGRPERHEFVSLENAYHGDTLGAVSAGCLPAFHRPFLPLLFEVRRAEAPFCSQCRYGLQPRNCGLPCFRSMKQILDRHHRRLAGVILEPLCQGAAGMRMYSPRYLAATASLCRRHGILLIVDEIAMGFGRTGTFFAFEQAGIDPDIVCLGKGLSGGALPLSATVVKDFIFRTFGDRPRDHTFYHGHTFGGNPIAAAAALATLKLYRTRNILRQARRLAAIFEESTSTFAALPRVKDVRCLGAILAVELKAGRSGEAQRHAQTIRRELFREGILIRPLGAVIYLMPPLVTPEPVARRLLRQLHRAIERTTHQGCPSGRRVPGGRRKDGPGRS